MKEIISGLDTKATLNGTQPLFESNENFLSEQLDLDALLDTLNDSTEHDENITERDCHYGKTPTLELGTDRPCALARVLQDGQTLNIDTSIARAVVEDENPIIPCSEVIVQECDNDGIQINNSDVYLEQDARSVRAPTSLSDSDWNRGNGKPDFDVHIPFIKNTLAPTPTLNLSAYITTHINQFFDDNFLSYELVPRIRFIHKFNNPLGLILFNYDPFARDPSTVSCNCAYFLEFCEPKEIVSFDNSSHIVTGNCNIFNQFFPKAVELLSKGTKFRTLHNPSYFNKELQRTIQELCENIECFLFEKKGLAEVPPLHALCEAIHVSPTILGDTKERSSMHECLDIRKLFVMTPVDKAPSNFSFTCPLLYEHFLREELGIFNSSDRLSQTDTSTNDTYEFAQESMNEVLRRNKSFSMQLDANYNPEAVEPELPQLYAIPKLHKPTAQMRYITAAHKSSLKHVSHIAKNILKLFRTQFSDFAGNAFVSISNSVHVSENPDIHNYGKLRVMDFSSLFTSIPHDCILDNIHQMNDLCFERAGKTFIKVGKNNCLFTTDKSADRCYTKQQVKELITFLVTKSYFTYKGHVFHQTKGVPQGGNASPFLADLTLSMIEYLFLNRNSHLLSKALMFRFVDDIAIFFNDVADFDQLIAMYPNYLSLEAANDTDTCATFLDLQIDRVTDSWTMNLFNKTDGYSFNVIRYPMYDSNIDSIHKVGWIFGEIIRINRCTSSLEFFKVKIEELVGKLFRNGFSKEQIIATFNRVLNRHERIAQKYNADTSELIEWFTNTVNELYSRTSDCTTLYYSNGVSKYPKNSV